MRIAASHLYEYAYAVLGLEDPNTGGPGYTSYEEYRQAYPLEGDETGITAEEWVQLETCKLKSILAASEMSEARLGGDDILDYIDQTVAVVLDGYAVYTWYGNNSEALALGYRPEELEIYDDEVADSDEES